MQAQPRQVAGPLATFKANKREAAVLEFSSQIMSALYDFSLDGGAVGTYSFGISLPANAVVKAIYADVQTAATSGGSATYQLKAGSSDLTADIAFDSATAGIDDAGVLSLPLNVSSPFDCLKLSSASELKLSIETAALTAGKVRFAVEYYISK